ncbi:hypothetical protein BH24DEI2_BH24DEI2_15540 [soil metagenome]
MKNLTVRAVAWILKGSAPALVVNCTSLGHRLWYTSIM